jgi:putative membrane protein
MFTDSIFPTLIAEATWDGIDGFLGTRGSIMLDIVFLTMFAVVPVLLFSIYAVKYRQKYDLHRKIQLTLGIVLLLAVTAFEIDMQVMTDWEARAEPSPYFDLVQKWTCPVGISMLVHLCFAVPTALLWIFVIVRALKKFPKPTTPNEYSATHIRWAKPAALGMFGTAVTGWIFYVLAFVLR